MSKEWPQFDWSTVDPDYPSKAGIYECSNDGLTNRGILAKEWLKNRPEKVIAVVSHSGFLRCAVSNRQYENADFRIFDFKADSLELVEWELTERPGEENGGGLGKSPSGFYPMTSQDYIPKPVGEVVNENPQ
jgi:broad specificity phosphatase PhoE